MSKPYRDQDESKSNRRRNRGKQEAANWESADPRAIAEAIIAVTLAGGAIRFGYTRGDGAFAVGYLGDGEPYTDYIRPSDDINEYLAQVVISWTGDADPTPIRK